MPTLEQGREIQQVRERLAADLYAIEGIKRLYDTLAEQMPESPDLPCFELDTLQPFMTSRGASSGQTEDTLHFNITFLLKPQNAGKAVANIQEVERYAMLTKRQLYGNFTGAGLYLINKDTGTLEWTGYLLTKDNAPEGNKYWGFTLTLDVTMLVETTMNAGV